MLLVLAKSQLHRARGRAEVGDRLPELAEAGAVEELARGLRDGEAGEGPGILPLELTAVVGQQPLADQLQQDVVVALERDVDVEVVVKADQAVLGEEARAAAGLAGLLDRVERVPGRQGLERRREGLEVFALLRGVAAAREHAVELAQQLVVREELGVVLGEQGQQATLVLAVVEQHDLFAAGSGVELAALVGVRERDVQRERGAGGGGAVERHAALDERAEHREEPAAGAGDVARVRAVGRDVAVAVEEVLARDADVIEVQPAVVDAVEAALDAVVLAADAREELAVVVAQRHEEAVHAVVHAAGDELGEDRRGLAVQRGVAEVVLPRAAERRVDHELLGVGVVGGRRADGRDIRSVSGLGHREGAGDLEVHDRPQPLVVVLLRAELVDGRAEQAPLHAGLDLQAGVGQHELHEAREVRAVVVEPAVLLGDRAARSAVLERAGAAG